MQCEALTIKNKQCKNNVINNARCCVHHNDKETCQICLNIICNNYFLICGHVFHKKCINRWFKNSYENNTCPICREHIHHFIHIDLHKILDSCKNYDFFKLILDITPYYNNKETFKTKIIELFSFDDI